MAQTYIIKNLDPDDIGAAARQLTIASVLAQRIAAEALQPVFQTGALQNVNVSYGTQTVVACQANAAFYPSSRADALVYQI